MRQKVHFSLIPRNFEISSETHVIVFKCIFWNVTFTELSEFF